ncbi:MAG: ATP synthase subunit I [Thermodesulforhabdaceae bacterium]
MVVVDRELNLIVEKIKIVNGLLGAIAILIGCAVSWKTGIGVFVGWLLMALNLEVLEWQLKRIFGGAVPPRNKFAVFLKYYVRFLVLVAIIWLIIDLGLVQPLALSAGLLVFGLSFIVVAGEIFIKMVLKREG